MSSVSNERIPHSGLAAINAARRKFFDQGDMPPPSLGVPEHVLYSWRRCRMAKLHPEERQDFDAVAKAELAELHEGNRDLLLAADPVMEAVLESMHDAPSVMMLTDAKGVILRSRGHDKLLDVCHRSAAREGVRWDEGNKGTNAMGTTLLEQRPVVIHGAEHYVAANSIFTCAAAPIWGPFGDMVGVLDVTGYASGSGPFPLAFINMAAQLIENDLFRLSFADCLLLRFHTRAEFVGTLREAIAVLSPDGRILAMNRAAAQITGLAHGGLADSSFGSEFDMAFGAFRDRARDSALGIVPLALRNGTQVFARVEGGPRGQPRAASRAGAESTASLPAAALDLLDTGDAAVRIAIGKARRALTRNLNILIQGETGTGKEVFAKHLHAESPRRNGPFVAVNCAAIPEGLIESELFGYEDGAFTGARRKGSLGKVAQAHGGTLFLDEIGDMAPALQARLLRVIQDRSITPLGGDAARPVDIAIICATHCDLRSLAGNGLFREDLYYRLNGITLTLPPLRQRSDLAALVQRILAELCGGQLQHEVSGPLMRVFEGYAWPGNLRQLHHVLEVGLAMLDGERVIDVGHLQDDFIADIDAALPDGDRGQAAGPGGDAPEPGPAGRTAPAQARSSLKLLETTAILQALQENDGNISAAARQLGIGRVTIYRKLRQQEA